MVYVLSLLCVVIGLLVGYLYVIMFVPNTGALWTAVKAQPDLCQIAETGCQAKFQEPYITVAGRWPGGFRERTAGT